MAVTRKDVAQMAGVSVATVSYVINGTKNVTPEVRERVMQAVQTLDYHPNLLAKSLATKETRHVAMLVDNIQNPHYGSILSGVQHIAEREGYIVSILSANYSSRDSMIELISRGVDGVILATGLENVDDLISGLSLPAIHTNENFHFHYRQAIFDMVGTLKSLGHRRIAFLSGMPDRTMSVRYTDLVDALHHYELPVYEELFMEGDGHTGEHDGYVAAGRLLATGEPFSAVFALNDLMAIGVMRRFWEEGLQIPRDVSIVGCDGIQSAAYTTPPLSTIQCDAFQFGEALMQQLLSILHPEKYPPIESKIIQAEFLRRESIGPAPHINCQEA